MIGNGWIDPKNQYPAYLDYLVEKNLVKLGSKNYKIVKVAVDLCLVEMQKMEDEGTGEKGMVLIPVSSRIWNFVI